MSHLTEKDLQRIRETMATPIPQHPGHRNAMSRRDLLARGVLGMATFTAMPNVLGIASGIAYGETVCSAPANDTARAAYLHIELTGGAGLSGNFMFGKQRDGSAPVFLNPAAYASLGIPANLAPGNLAPNTEFMGALHPASGLLAGLKAAMTDPAAIAKSVIVGGAGTSDDDSAGNQLNGIQLAVKILEAKGNLVSIVGTESSNTGGRTAALAIGQDAAITKARVSNAQDVLNLVNPGLIASKLSAADAKKIVDAAKKMSSERLAAFNEKDLPAQVKTLVDCGYIGSGELLTQFTPAALAATSEPNVYATPFNLNDANDARLATILKLLLDGNALAASIQLGGYDYHGLGRRTQDDKDTAAGRLIGLALLAAHRKNKPLFIAVTSDGAVAAGGNGTPDAAAGGKIGFTSDSGVRGSYLMLAIGQTKRPELNFTQIGAYSDSGAVDTTYLATATSAPLQALNIVYNFAAFNNKLGTFDKVLAALGQANPFAGKDRQFKAFNPFG